MAIHERSFISLLGDVSKESPYGIGDDAALLGDYLVAKDIMAEGVHFLPTEPIADVVERLFYSNISDLAAMGCQDDGYFALFGVAFPSADSISLRLGDIKGESVLSACLDRQKFADVVKKVAKELNVALIGGDTVSGGNELFLSLTVLGKRGRHVLTRSGAKPGDTVYLSRPVGYSRYVLEERLKGRYVNAKFLPETSLGASLGEIGVHSCIDVSDGLGVDLNHIATQSDVCIVVATLPKRLGEQNSDMLYKLASGEEYALVFTAPPAMLDRLNVPLHPIGKVYPKDELGCGVFAYIDGAMTDISNLGYEHE